jgi:nitronate monooxygenase
MWTRTSFSEFFAVEFPIVQGPFGGNNSTPELASAVSNAGGLGSFGAVDLEPVDVGLMIKNIASRTRRPFAVNLWLPIAAEEPADIPLPLFARACEALRPYFEGLGLALPDLPRQPVPDFERQVEALLAARPAVFSFVMGVPDPNILKAAKARGIKTIGTATSVEEAVAIADAGADAVVASGSDAGGHRGSFLRPVESSLIGTFSLVPQIRRAVPIPVIAAGGIADGQGIAAALTLGAHAAQIGTAFLATEESGAPAAHKARLGQAGARSTRLTRAFTGRYARGIENELMLALERNSAAILPYPFQHALTQPLRRDAAQAGRAEGLALWAGQNAAAARHLPAAELLRLLVAETDQALSNAHLAPRRVGIETGATARE